MKLLVLLALVGVTVASRPYITGGDIVTEAGKYPWQGSLRFFGSHICGISLINPRWGLTAAQCVEGVIGTFTAARFGSNRHASGGVTASIRRVIMHENYDEGAGYLPNDIAVVEFERPVEGPNIASIKMAESGDEHAGNDDCWITGWGSTRVGGNSISSSLHEAKVKVYTQTFCEFEWENDITSGMVCAGDKAQRRTSCQGDRGGPLMCRVNDVWELVGVSSWGAGGCDPDQWSVYSRTSAYRSWVMNNTGI